jgi:hypothetical protein
MARNVGNWFENARQVLAGISTGQETTYVASGVASLADKVAILDGTNALTFLTLADGSTIGQSIMFTCIDSTSACSVTLASPITSGTDVVTFTAGDAALMTWTSAGWGVVQGITIA